MAGVPVTGNVSTEEVLSDERVIDMDSTIRRLKTDDAQFTTMTRRLPSKVAVREKVNWLEEEDFPRIVTSSAGYAVSVTTIVLTATHGKLVAVNDLLRNMRTGEGMRVTAVSTDTLTVDRGVGALFPGTGAAINALDPILVVADSQPQGSDFPTPRYLQRVLGYNYTQITRTTLGFTNTTTSIELYGGREPAKEVVRLKRVDDRKWEAIAFWGMRAFQASTPPDNEPKGAAGGLLEFIQTFKRDANGPLTPTFFDLLLMDSMQYGSTDKVLFAAPVVVACMSAWNRQGMGAQWDPGNGRNVHGVFVDAFISGAYGYRIPVVVKKEFGEFYNTANPKGFGSYAFLVDMSLVARRPLRDRDTRMLTDQQPKGKDTYNAELRTEASLQIAQERAHAIIYGVTAPP